MKATGIVRKVDELGRVVIPKELRDVMNIKIKDPLEIYTEGDYILIKKYMPGCVFCGNIKNLKFFEGKNICTDCIKEITKK